MRVPSRSTPRGTSASYAQLRGAVSRVCPVCDAQPGWKCVKTMGDQRLPRVRAHKERVASK